MESNSLQYLMSGAYVYTKAGHPILRGWPAAKAWANAQTLRNAEISVVGREMGAL
ncbi:hypothetical protein J2Y66_003468 [Paenarthrobacter nitroguajacolicus]|nr:hypothetical protein [Paenarthrobacter nitroguajacolicus]